MITEPVKRRIPWTHALALLVGFLAGLVVGMWLLAVSLAPHAWIHQPDITITPKRPIT